jgi:hypothetical protein
MLLERDSMSPPAAIERLGGLQAQLARAPYLSLWTRLRDLRREALDDLIQKRTVIKATWIRATLHLCTADDYIRFRSTLQPMLTNAANTIGKGRRRDFDLNKLLAEARRYIAKKPRTFAEISEMVAEFMPEQDVGVLRYAVRTHLPLVQVPVACEWSYPNQPAFTLAESWIGRPLVADDRLKELALRYLEAFGPASVTDMQAWSGIPALKELFDRIKPKLQVYRGEGRREFFDLPDRAVADGDTPAPVRFLPEFDNLLLSHSNRTRVVAEEHRSRVYLPGLRVAATVLVDGFVHGSWKIEKTRDEALLVIEPFGKLTRTDRAALLEEGENLVRWVEPDSKSVGVRVAK